MFENISQWLNEHIWIVTILAVFVTHIFDEIRYWRRTKKTKDEWERKIENRLVKLEVINDSIYERLKRTETNIDDIRMKPRTLDEIKNQESWKGKSQM